MQNLKNVRDLLKKFNAGLPAINPASIKDLMTDMMTVEDNKAGSTLVSAIDINQSQPKSTSLIAPSLDESKPITTTMINTTGPAVLEQTENNDSAAPEIT